MKPKKSLKFLFICILLFNMQCNDDESVVVQPCGIDIILDNSAFNAAESHAIEGVIINNDCITITISDSGCDSSNWVMTLIDSENIAESMPPQRYLKLKLINNEVCLAYFNKQENFDLAPLRVEGLNEVILNIEGLATPITYTY